MLFHQLNIRNRVVDCLCADSVADVQLMKQHNRLIDGRVRSLTVTLLKTPHYFLKSPNYFLDAPPGSLTVPRARPLPPPLLLPAPPSQCQQQYL